MPKYHTIFDTHSHYINKYDCYSQGNSPRILGFIESFLKENWSKISEIYLCLSHFNNAALNDLLKELSEDGIKINLITIPIDGYSDQEPGMLTNLVNGQAAFEEAHSPFSLARSIYAAHYKRPTNDLKIHLFPHLSVEHNKIPAFKKGAMPYSLKANSFLVVYKKGGGAVGLSSTNFSVGEIVKDNHLIVIEDDWQLLKTSLRFFNSLIQFSFEINDFDFNAKFNHYKMFADKVHLDKKGYFTAPFYYESAMLSEEYLASIISQATRRIYITAPEINAYEYIIDGTYHTNIEDEPIENFGILRTLLERAALGVEVKCLAAIANNDDYSKQFLEVLGATANASFATNEMSNSRYIIVDDLLIITTGNFTPSQFIYLDNIQIEDFEHMPNESYSGIFAEVGQYILVEDSSTVQKYVHDFEERWQRPSTTIIAD